MTKYVAAVALAGSMLALPLVGEAYALRLGTLACMYAILASSWNIVGGLAGYPSFATAAFFGFGAYTSGLLAAKGAHLALGLAVAGGLAFISSLALGFVLLRLKGHYF